MQEVGAYKLAFDVGEADMTGKGLFHLVGTRLKLSQQVEVAPLEILEDLLQLSGSFLGAHGQNAGNNMICPRLISGVEVARFCRRFEWPYNHPRGIRPEIKSLPVQELNFGQNGPCY